MRETGDMEQFITAHGYLALAIISILESACVPIPSEVTFGVAGALCTTAITGHAIFSLPVVIIIGAVTSAIGSQIAYEIARQAGRPFVERFGKWFLVSHRDLDAAERWFEKRGSISVLISRVLPLLRSIISVPAGIAKMPRGRFISLTLVGSTAWVWILAYLGETAGKNWDHVSKNFHKAQNPIIAVLVLLIVAFVVVRLRAMRRHN
jgi:membrane protein DedA with SNARE-associated domain